MRVLYVSVTKKCMSPHLLSNLVELQDMAPPSMIDDQANRATLIAVQMEALCIKRRDILSTTDFKENKACYIPTKELESRRLINKGRIGEGEARKLKGWNSKIIPLIYLDRADHGCRCVDKFAG